VILALLTIILKWIYPLNGKKLSWVSKTSIPRLRAIIMRRRLILNGIRVQKVLGITAICQVEDMKSSSPGSGVT